MKFTTPCFVRVDDMKERRKLLIWLHETGYDLYQSARSLNYPILCANMVDDENGNIYGEYAEELTGISRDVAIDCGSNIELFKALAAMMEGPEITEQYMYATADLFTAKSLSNALLKKMKCVVKKGQLIKAERLSGLYFDSIRKATAEEIIEHFKK